MFMLQQKRLDKMQQTFLIKLNYCSVNMDEYFGLINKLENTLQQQQAKEMEEKRKVEALKAAEKNCARARKAEKG
jgi:hypothetical protein